MRQGQSGDIRSFFEPRSVAVAGVSSDPGKLGSIIFANLRENVEKGILKASVYALNPSRTRIGDQPCYPAIGSLPETPELLIIAVPVSLTLDLVRQAAEAGVKAVVMVTGGFSEVGRKDLEAEIGRLARMSGMRVLGPNTIGLLDTRSGVDSLFLRSTKTLPDGSEIVSLLEPLKGGVVVITQSGHLGEIISEELAAHGVGIRALVGTGNQLDISVEDVIGYFTDDEHTKVVALYLEGISDGRRFMRVAAQVARKKPIVVFKVGKTRVGARAALTHTASLVGDYQLYKAAFRKAGLIEAGDLQELIDYCVSFSMIPKASGKRLAVITNAGGVGAITADEAEKSGFDVSPLGKGAEAMIRSEFREASFISNASLGNPMDLTASATADEFARMAERVLGLQEYDFAIMLPSHQTPIFSYDISTRLATAVSKTGKPTCMCVMGHSELANRIQRDFMERGIPSFPTPERAVRALSAVVAYNGLRPATSVAQRLHRTDSQRGLVGLQGLLSQPQVGELLHSYGIAQPESSLVKSPSDLKAAARVGFPVACKFLSAGLPHKTEAGGVILNVRSLSGLTAALSRFKKLSSERGVRFDGMLVQRMVEGGIEAILGGTRDATFGPTVLFGVGGTYTELIRDYAVAIAPVTLREAKDMVARTRLGPVLSGYRGGPKVDLDELCGVISRFSRIMVENPSVEQMEINPLIATNSGILSADARVVVSPARV